MSIDLDKYMESLEDNEVPEYRKGDLVKITEHGLELWFGEEFVSTATRKNTFCVKGKVECHLNLKEGTLEVRNPLGFLTVNESTIEEVE